MSWDEIRAEIIEELKPREDEELQLLGFADRLITQLNSVLNNNGIDALAEVHGSVAHGTWISGQQDLDVFLVIEKYIGREQLQRALDAVRAGTDWEFTEAYAEHPYLQTRINGYSIDIVPCFRLDNGELHSSTDRTPLHTRWLETRLGGLGFSSVS